MIIIALDPPVQYVLCNCLLKFCSSDSVNCSSMVESDSSVWSFFQFPMWNFSHVKGFILGSC